MATSSRNRTVVKRSRSRGGGGSSFSGWSWVARAASLTVLLLCVCAGYEYGTLPDPAELESKNPPSTALIDQRVAEAKAEGRKPRRRQTWISLSSVPKYALDAVLVSEDARFYDHEGVDLKEVRTALEDAWEKKQLGRGASTITQQVAKNLWLSEERSIFRKAKELILTRRMEERLTKRRILTLYLNIAEWGNGVYGLEAAAQEHFNVSASQLTPGKAAMLASMLPSPRKWTPASKSDRLRQRSLRLVDRLQKYERITAAQATSARSEIFAVLGGGGAGKGAPRAVGAAPSARPGAEVKPVRSEPSVASGSETARAIERMLEEQESLDTEEEDGSSREDELPISGNSE